MITFLLIVTLCYIAYSVWVAKGIPASLSETYYMLGGKAWIFQVVMMMNGFGLLPLWINQSEDNLRWLVFLACAGLCFVATAPMFKEKMQGIIHYSCAAVSGISSVIWVLAMGYYPIFLIGAIVFWMANVASCKWMWSIEIAVIGMVYLSLL